MARIGRWLAFSFAVSGLSCLAAGSARAEAVKCIAPDSAQQSAPSSSANFWAYRFGLPFGSLKYRDLEFLWDPANDLTLTPELEATLLNFAGTLVDSIGKNPFGASMSDFELIYTYFRHPAFGLPYTYDPRDTNSVYFGQAAQSYNPSDRSHVDVYLFHPSRATADGAYRPGLVSGEEDLSTGHSPEDIKHDNSLMVKAPSGPGRIDLTGTGWTAPDAFQNVVFNHEFRHGFPSRIWQGMMGEMFSAGAEAVGGNASIEPSDEVPYTWSPFSFLTTPSPTCTFLRAQGDNYQGRSAFTAYLAYNFRGADTSATATGFQDDLLFKWSAANAPSVTSLRDLLKNDSCGTCATKAYFHPNESAMSDTLRLALLMHHWRVANYVNNSFLEEGQYGYPPHFGFAPSKQLSAWRDIDWCATDNVIAVPSEVTLNQTHVTRDTVLRDVRYSGSGSFPMVLIPFGSEYWIVKSDPAIHRPGQDLTIRVIPDSADLARHQLVCDLGIPDYARTDARLFASVVGYREQTDSLWKHPEWVTRVLAPRWVDLDTLGREALEFTVPSFGDTTRAVLVVLSLADGTAQHFSSISSGGAPYHEFLSYRLQLGVRSAPFLVPNPRPIAGEPSILEEQPTFSPDGTMVAYTEFGPTGPSSIYLRAADGSGRAILRANSVPPGQGKPDWSPRGDWIAYEDYQGGWPYSDIHAFNRTTQQHLILTPALDGAHYEPAFSPNGQQIAYISRLLGAGGELTGNWSLRRINMGATSATTLVTGSPSRPLRMPRWSPDGQWVFFLAGDSLYAVGARDSLQGQVISMAGTLNHATAFDLHRGRGPIAFEEADSFLIRVECTVGDGYFYKAHPYRRIALRDTLQRLPIPQFQKRFAAYFSPR